MTLTQDKRYLISFLSLLALLLLFTVTGKWHSSPSPLPEERGAVATAPPTPDEQVEAILANMTTAEKIGQIMMVGLYSTAMDDEARYLLDEMKVGGIILFDRNMKTAEQTAALTQDLQNYAQGQGGQKLPLLIAVDEEGGRVARGREFIDPPPSQQSVGETGSPEAAASIAGDIAARLRPLGFNVNFAPVADVDGKSSRSFGADAGKVADFIAAAAQGYEEAGFLYTLKHFPGLGKSEVDPHLEVSKVTASLEELKGDDILPFARVIESKAPDSFLVMVSHLIYTGLDPENSATLSGAVMTDLLRRDLGYQGIIITDDMAMGAVANHESFDRLGVKAFLAGADIILICHEMEHKQAIHQSLTEAVARGEISEERLNESVRRVLKTKFNHLQHS